jgi:hypothetical protein
LQPYSIYYQLQYKIFNIQSRLAFGKGKLAPSNAALVAKMRCILEELSIDIATADEARTMLETKGGANVKF